MSPTLQRVLLVEDDEADSLFVRELLANIANVTFEVEWVRTYDAACEALTQSQYDLCLLDYRLGGHTGLELLQELPQLNRLPTIILTGHEDYQVDAAFAKAGAADYLVKRHLNTPVLERSIRYAIQRKASENSLLQAQQLAQSIVDSLPDNIAVLDSQGVILAVNATWTTSSESTFIGAGTGVGANYPAICEADDSGYGQTIAAGIRRMMVADAGQEPFGLEYLSSSHQECWFELRVTRLAGGAPLHVMVVHENITARKKAEAQLRASEANLAKAQQMASLGSWEFTLMPHGGDEAKEGQNLLRWSDELYRILGYSPDESEASYEAFLKAVHPDDLVAVEATMEQAVLDQASCEFEHRVVLPDGMERFVRAQVNFVFEASGKATRMVGTVQDITRRKRDEQALEATIVEILTIWESMTDAFFSLDTQWRFTYVNYQAAHLWQKSAVDLIGKIIWEEFPGAVGTKFHSEYLRAQAEQVSTRFEAYYPPKSVWREVRAYPSSLGLSVYFHDITERKEAEAQFHFQKTLLQAQTEASLDGILVVSEAGKILSYNQRFMQIWGIPQHIVNAEDDGLALRAILDNLVDPEQFQERVAYLYKNRDERSQDEILLKGGRVLDRYSAAIAGDDGTYYGRVWYFRDITERKNSAAALEQSNREILTIWESMTDAFYAVDTQWRFTHINSQAANLLQRDSGEIIGKNLWEEFPEAVTLAFYGEYHRAFDEQIPIVFEEYFAPLGMWVELHVYPSPLGVSVYFRDISRRKHSDQELRASEARFQRIVSNVPGMVYKFVLNPDGSIQFPFVSDGSLDLVGLAPAEIRDDPMALIEVIHPDDREYYERTVAESVATLEPWTWEGRGRMRSGQIKWVQGVSRPSKQPDESTVWDGLLIDVTDRKEAEEERDRFFTLSLDMLAIVEPTGYFKRVNPAFEVTLGYSTAELMATPLINFVHPDDKEMTLAEIAKFETGVTNLSFVNRNFCRDGSCKWMSWQVVLFENLRYVVAHDITPVIEAEAALRRANEELELHVAERTAELASANEGLRIENIERYMTMAALRQVAEAYRVAKEESDAANKAKSEFLSRMSHELRTPLNAILGFGQILQTAGLAEQENEHVSQIINGGWHLLDLINEILDIARVESGNLEMLLESVSLADIIVESCGLVRPLAAQRKVHLDTSALRDESCNVRADRQRLKQVFINLISNGIKYNRIEGQVSISCHPAPGGRMRIAVRDTGLGISPQDKAKLFTPFERLSAADSDIEGTGLGLVLSKHLLTAMGGTLDVESVVGEGSTFWIDLDEAGSPHESVDASPASPIYLPVTTQSGRAYTILSIEDNAPNQQLLREILVSRPQVTLLCASLGLAGLDLARKNRPDLILLNLKLPDISGQEILSQLRQSQATAEIPVIVVSADATPPHIERLLAAGAAGYLTKPYNVAQLLAALDTALHPVTTNDNAVAESTSSSTSPTLPSAPVEAQDAPTRSLRVLVAEDNLVNQKVVSYQLRNLGHQAFLVEDGEAVVKAWQEGQYDLILMDCHMPGMDGYAATREIRRLEAGKQHIPIVALTANALAEDREKSLASGMDDHLSKPIKQAELAQSLSQNIAENSSP